MKNVLLLGATGSIGKSVLSVISQNKESLNLIGISFNKNVSRYQEILEKHSPDYVYIEDHDSFKSLCSKDKERYLNGDEELERLINRDDVDIIVCATSGFAGLKTAYIASKTGKKILLANKESIVAGGDLILSLAKANNTKIIPIDSEHNAIFQCLSGEKSTEDVKSITITASGGPFINASIQELQHVTVEDALNHPNWKMGKKISIDSATMMNKGLEVIEAFWLFKMNPSKIEIIVHPQSIIHSMVQFKDGSIKAQLGVPDMKIPIQYALTYPRHLSSNWERLDFFKCGDLTFQEPDFERFPSISLAFRALDLLGTAGTALNLANDITVGLFLNEQILFTDIPRINEVILEEHPWIENPTLEDITNLEEWVKEKIYNL